MRHALRDSRRGGPTPPAGSCVLHRPPLLPQHSKLPTTPLCGVPRVGAPGGRRRCPRFVGCVWRGRKEGCLILACCRVLPLTYPTKSLCGICLARKEGREGRKEGGRKEDETCRRSTWRTRHSPAGTTSPVKTERAATISPARAPHPPPSPNHAPPPTLTQATARLGAALRGS